MGKRYWWGCGDYSLRQTRDEAREVTARRSSASERHFGIRTTSPFPADDRRSTRLQPTSSGLLLSSTASRALRASASVPAATLIGRRSRARRARSRGGAWSGAETEVSARARASTRAATSGGTATVRTTRAPSRCCTLVRGRGVRRMGVAWSRSGGRAQRGGRRGVGSAFMKVGICTQLIVIENCSFRV